jgi:hypothetical protein
MVMVKEKMIHLNLRSLDKESRWMIFMVRYLFNRINHRYYSLPCYLISTHSKNNIS